MSKPKLSKPKRRTAKRSLPAMDWIDDVTGRCARATAVGNRSLLVENYTAILAFDPNCVRLATASGTICVAGRDLTLRDVRPRALIVHGDINRVDLPCEGGGAPDER